MVCGHPFQNKINAVSESIISPKWVVTKKRHSYIRSFVRHITNSQMFLQSKEAATRGYKISNIQFIKM